MSLDKLVENMIETVRNEERRNKAMPLNNFKFERDAKALIEPAKNCAAHHRKREKHYMSVLDDAEKVLREKGVTIEAVNNSGSLASGSMYGASSNLQPKIDSTMLEAVKNAKSKVLEHRSAAEGYERYARAFTCCPRSTQVELRLEDVYYFRLES